MEDKYPSAQLHFLVIPKVHYENYRVAPDSYLHHSLAVARLCFDYPDIRFGYHRWYSVPHLHLHCVVPPYTSCFGRVKFMRPFFLPIAN